MHITPHTTWIAFAHNKCIASGNPKDVVTDVKTFFDSNPTTNILVLDAVTSATIELDLRGAMATVLRRLPKAIPEEPVQAQSAPAPSPNLSAGRPKLGVVPREVTLLPRHWTWLASQPGGSSVALRKLVEHALRSSKVADQKRKAQESAYRFMLDLAGDNAGFEEASRALFAGDMERLQKLIAKWPRDVRQHLLLLASASSGIENNTSEDR
ncbi:MAG: DUF2239 family protein [Pseudomonadota bacterium]